MVTIKNLLGVPLVVAGFKFMQFEQKVTIPDFSKEQVDKLSECQEAGRISITFQTKPKKEAA